MVNFRNLSFMLAGLIAGSSNAINLPSGPILSSEFAQSFSTDLNLSIPQVKVDSSSPAPASSSRLHGLTYSPFTPSSCLDGNQIAAQLKLISNQAGNIRLYSNDCDQISKVLNGIKSQGLGVKVLLGIWTRGKGDSFLKDAQLIVDLIKKDSSYKSYISGLTVGNEEVFNGASEGQVISNINAVKGLFKGAGINDIPIGTAEVGHKWTPGLVEASDKVYANIYSFFSAPPSSSSMALASVSVITQANTLKSTLAKGKQVVISETGWPTSGTANGPTYAPATSSNAKSYLEGLMCQASKAGYEYYVLEAFDATWKHGPTIEQNFGVLSPSGGFKFGSLSAKC